MSRINVLVATTSPDVKAEVIAASVAARPDMNLVRNRSLAVSEVDAALDSIAARVDCALVLVGDPVKTNELGQRWLAKHTDLVVLHVDVIGDNVRIGLRDPMMDALLTTLRELVQRFGTGTKVRVAHFQLPPTNPAAEGGAGASPALAQRPLLQATIRWVHTVLRAALERIPVDNGDLNGLSLTRDTILQSLDESFDRASGNDEMDAALDRALASRQTNPEPLAVAAREFGLSALEYRFMALTLAPELDIRFQRCIGFLLDDISRRVGTLGLYCSLLGLAARVRNELSGAGALARWLVFEGSVGRPATADEPLRLDPFLAQWLLGDDAALANDPRVRRAMHPLTWPGINILMRAEDHVGASTGQLMDKLLGPGATKWVLLGGNDPSAWRALLELGARNRNVALIRVEPASLAGDDVVDVEECAKRVGRMMRLTGHPLVIDITKADGAEGGDDRIQLFLATLGHLNCRAAMLYTDQARIVRLLGSAPYELVEGQAFSMPSRIAVVRAAATGADANLTDEMAEAMASRYPLQLDGLEHAMHLAASRPKNPNADDPWVARFADACREVVSDRLSHLAERIEPIFGLDQVVLPPDRKQQLSEIVDHVRLATKVLDGWKFRDQLPYGRGVTALFHGPSGTGKTMAAVGVARRLGIQILRIDLSRTVSKYIGDTEKNIDRVFEDAQRSGSAILIDEADALLGKRSEVKDAHDRYANIEVAYLLQRMEAYDGLAILTTNMRQNLDAAFLRCLRFIVDFPRPDVDAREKIWRQCLPDESHELDDAAFRQISHRIDLTGGHIRQITLRAAFIAATGDMLINLQHIAQATRAELAKLGMPPVEFETARVRRLA